MAVFITLHYNQLMPFYRTTSYRYPFERMILFGTLLLVIAIIILSATFTLSLAGFFILFMLGFSYLANRSQHASLIQRSYPINSRSSPDLIRLARACQRTSNLAPSRFTSLQARISTPILLASRIPK